MIPVKLTIRNFMPYRDNVPTLDFTGIHTASICGDNGSGKSSIIDAMTWALWGETRAKNKDDVINQNQQEAEVEFEFAVGEQRYRIIRKHARPKRRGTSGQTALHLQIASDGGFRAIDGDTMTRTQDKIVEILNMDYNTFTNSAYLRQGHADEFTTASPAKRKEVLTKILDLGVYDNLETKAKEIVRERDAARIQLERSIADIDQELLQLPACQTELKQEETETNRIDDAVKQQEIALTDLRHQKETLEAKNARLTQIEKSLAEEDKHVRQLQEQVSQLQARIKEHEALIVRKVEIEDGYTSFIEIKNRNEVLTRNLSVFTRLNQKKHELDMWIAREGQTLVSEHRVAQAKIAELEIATAEIGRWQEELRSAKQQMEQLGQNEQSLHQRQQNRQELLTQIGGLETDRTRLEKEISEIDEKLRLLHTEKSGTCPLCGSNVGEVGIKHIENQYDTDRQQRTDALKAIRTEIQVKQTEVKLMSEEISLSDKMTGQERLKLQSRLSVAEREISRSEEANRHLTDEKRNLGEIEGRLSSKSFAGPHQELLRQIEGELEGLKYDHDEHDSVRRLYENLKQWEIPKQKLDESERLLDQESEYLAGNEQMLREIQQAMAEGVKNREELRAETVHLQPLYIDVQNKESELKSLMQEQKKVRERLGSIKERINYLEKRTDLRKEKEREWQKASQEAQIYAELAEAFGKKGVQALIIETALPEIENEANRLLVRMTDGRMTVKIETQRETQKGDTVETLDIKISDELGTRSYEMFSGGEAFRINFAIRIALSRLLARRKGAPLPTLIVDEGFGTQDAGGIEKLREAITAIQDDFEKILVITHIEELRDAFPARIDVVKTPNGSTINLN